MGVDIVTCGFPIVELYRKYMDQPLDRQGEFIGPFAAGDPVIMVIACMKQGHTGGYVGVAGKDRLADCFFEGMRKNNVDTSHIRIDPKRSTAISLLAKFSDGNREFAFTLKDSAAGTLCVGDFDSEYFRNIRCLHVSGAALSVSESIVELHDMVLNQIGKDVLVTFDPNYRENLVDVETFRKISANAFKRCDVFLPSMGEARIFCPEAGDEIEACRAIADTGKMVALKDGANGAYGFWKDTEVFIKALQVEEVDPTGAGDTFGGALVGALLNGKDFFTAVHYGAAAGALAASREGLMENVPTLEEVEALLAENM